MHFYNTILSLSFSLLLLIISSLTVDAQPKTTLSGYVMDLCSGEPLENARLIIKDHRNIEIKGESKTVTNAEGWYKIAVDSNKIYHLTLGVEFPTDSVNYGYIVVSDTIRSVGKLIVNFGVSETDVRYLLKAKDFPVEKTFEIGEWTRNQLMKPRIMVGTQYQPWRVWQRWVRELN